MAADPESLRNGANESALKTKHFNFTAPGWGLAEDLKMFNEKKLIERYNGGTFDDTPEIMSMLNMLAEDARENEMFNMVYPLTETVDHLDGLFSDYREAVRLIKVLRENRNGLVWHPFDGSVEPTANKRYLVMHYDNAPQDKTTLEHDYEFSVMICEQDEAGEKLFACTCKGDFIEPSEHVYFAEFPNLPTHITED